MSIPEISTALLLFFGISFGVLLISGHYLLRILRAGYSRYHHMHFTYWSKKEFAVYYFGLWFMVVVGGTITAVSACNYIKIFLQ